MPKSYNVIAIKFLINYCGGIFMDKAQVISIIAEQLGISETDITEETSFTDLGADSLDLFQIISAFEEEFNIEFENEDVEKIKTVGDAIDYIKNVVE